MLVRLDNTDFDKFCQAVDKKDKQKASKYLSACLSIVKTGSNSRFWAHSGDDRQVQKDLELLSKAQLYKSLYERLSKAQ